MKRGAFIFAGPTLAQSGFIPPDGVTMIGPAAQGDVYRAALENPTAIGIIDGYFEGQASIWHKEILWAMDQGIHLFGSASMGALRAAELQVFGMQGVGRIFEDYRDGVLDDDDEVAVLHAPADAGFMPLSEPMVTIRTTLAKAAERGVIDKATAGLLARVAKETFYQERRWADILEAVAGDVDEKQLAAFKTWLPENRVDQKAIDALAMIEAVTACLDRAEAPPPVDYHFEWTEMWDEVVRSGEMRPSGDIDKEGASGEAILDEARLESTPDAPLFRLALLRRLTSRQEADDSSSRKNRAKATAEFRERIGLFRRTDLDRWMQQQHLDEESFHQVMKDELVMDRCLVDQAGLIGRYALDQLRWDDRYARLAERADAKQTYLGSIGQTDPSAETFTLSQPQLRAWFFEQKMGQPIPDDIDGYAKRLGFKDYRSFDQALRREYLYVIGMRE